MKDHEGRQWVVFCDINTQPYVNPMALNLWASTGLVSPLSLFLGYDMGLSE